MKDAESQLEWGIVKVKGQHLPGNSQCASSGTGQSL